METFKGCVMKKICANFQWYNIIVIVCISAFSLLCWGNFARKAGSAFVSYVETSTEDEKENKIAEYVDMLDGYMDEADSVWDNAIIKKGKLSILDNYYTYFLTREIASCQVVDGKNNWLFYKSTVDGDPIEDYEGTNRYSSSKMKDILNQALATQEELNSRNIKLAIMVAPNKENIYSEYMPDTYTHAEVSSTDILIDYLAENGVHIVSPKQELLENRAEFQLYYSYDTHWNQLGAYVGVKNVLKSWEISKPELAERAISSYNLAGNYHYCGVDDLAKMLGMRSFFYNDEIEYEIEGTGVMDWKKLEEEQNNDEVSYFYNPDAKLNAKLLLAGDSFRVSMIPSLRETFSDVYVVHRSYYTPDLLDEIEPEYLIAEYVERYSGEIGGISLLINH
jgi:hypothetical protein